MGCRGNGTARNDSSLLFVDRGAASNDLITPFILWSVPTIIPTFFYIIKLLTHLHSCIIRKFEILCIDEKPLLEAKKVVRLKPAQPQWGRRACILTDLKDICFLSEFLLNNLLKEPTITDVIFGNKNWPKKTPPPPPFSMLFCFQVCILLCQIKFGVAGACPDTSHANAEKIYFKTKNSIESGGRGRENTECNWNGPRG